VKPALAQHPPLMGTDPPAPGPQQPADSTISAVSTPAPGLQSRRQTWLSAKPAISTSTFARVEQGAPPPLLLPPQKMWDEGWVAGGNPMVSHSWMNTRHPASCSGRGAPPFTRGLHIVSTFTQRMGIIFTIFTHCTI
jgi:hypothetical protein